MDMEVWDEDSRNKSFFLTFKYFEFDVTKVSSFCALNTERSHALPLLPDTATQI